MSKLRVSLCQFATGVCKRDNLAKAAHYVAQAAAGGAELVVLPECFHAPYVTRLLPDYAEPASPGNLTYDTLAQLALTHHVWLVGGSMVELAGDGKLYNTSLTFAPDGTLRGSHRKVHLFRINHGTVAVDEGTVLAAGNDASVMELDSGVMFGVCVCFDIRYPQLAYKYTQEGTSMLICPAAFNMVTGPLHWELMARARAVDNQQYVLMCSTARDVTCEYVAYGHSLVVDPMGRVVASMDEKEGRVDAELDFDLVTRTRASLPILRGVRHDLYTLEWDKPRHDDEAKMTV